MKRFFGVILLGVAIYLVSPLLPVAAHMLAWAALLIVSAIYLHAIDPLPPNASGVRKLFKGIGVIGLLGGASLLIGALSGGRDILQPLAGLRSVATSSERAPLFQRIDSPAQLDSAIRAAAGKPVMLDFYADWCVSCKEMERYTFVDDAVRAKMAGVVALQADVTQNLDDHKALLKRFNLFGPPGIVFFDRQGNLINDLRVVGFQPADKFAATLDLALR